MFNSKQRYQKKLAKAKQLAEIYELENQIAEIKKKKPRKYTTTKFIVFYLFVIFNVILIYSMVAMWKFMDLSYLGILLTDIASQIVVFLIYSIKAFKETKEEEKIKLEKSKLENIVVNAAEKVADTISHVSE